MNEKTKRMPITKKDVITALVYVPVAGVLWVGVAVIAPEHGRTIGNVVSGTYSKIIKIAVGIFFIIGLIQVWVPPHRIAQVLGKQAGWKGLLVASTVPMILGGALFMMFPLMKTLRGKGASLAAIIAFVTAWSGKAPLLPLEIEFMGIHFAILRIALVVPMAILCGITGEMIIEALARSPGENR